VSKQVERDEVTKRKKSDPLSVAALYRASTINMLEETRALFK
jgi:hypothetical protein